MFADQVLLELAVLLLQLHELVILQLQVHILALLRSRQLEKFGVLDV